MDSFKINYKSEKTELCEIGKKYDTDKSSQRLDVTDSRHCHPYTLFYDALFRNRRNDPLRIAELGILDGASLLMWRDYFPHAYIDGYEYNQEFTDAFRENHPETLDRISVFHVDVTDPQSIQDAFHGRGAAYYDIIIEDTTHYFYDQVMVIENVHQHLKPGGVLIIEDIFEGNKEDEYMHALQPVLEEHFQDYYFVTLDHVNRNSTGWDNDKLLVLEKKNGDSQQSLFPFCISPQTILWL